MPDQPAGIDRADPGYQRRCILRDCAGAMNILDIMDPLPGQDPPRGWHYAPRIFQGYVCPGHAGLARTHRPSWVRVDGCVTGCQCSCDRWMWLPGIPKTLGDYQDRYVAHLLTIDKETADA